MPARNGRHREALKRQKAKDKKDKIRKRKELLSPPRLRKKPVRV